MAELFFLESPLLVVFKCFYSVLIISYKYGAWFGGRHLALDVVLTIIIEGAYLISKSIFHKALNLVYLYCEITLESAR